MTETVHEIAFDDFSGRVGKIFSVPVRGHVLQLKLGAAQALPGSARSGGGFRLEFFGPPDPMLAQGIFPFEIEQRRFEIFVTPLSHDARGTVYEAVFF